jgi:hypothetical protein
MELNLLMSESKKPWGDGLVFDWYFQECDREIVVPIEGSNMGLAIVDAVSGIYDAVDSGRISDAKDHLIKLGELLVGNAYDIGEEIMHDIVVDMQMHGFEDDLEHMLQHAEEERDQEL